MHEWPEVAVGEIPPPGLVAALVTLRLVPTERVPLWAAYWLVDGYDGDSLRTLAGFSGANPYEVEDALPGALADCGTPIPDVVGAAAVAFTAFARLYLAGMVDGVWLTEQVERIAGRSDYAAGVLDLPLGPLYLFADEWGAGWGRTDQQLRAEVEQACAAQLAAAEPRDRRTPPAG